MAKQRNAALHPHNLYKEPEQTVQMGMRCQDGLSDPGITAWEVPKECAPSGADPGSLSLESTDKSNKDMLTDHYYSQVKVMLLCAYLWGREISLSLGAVVWKSDACRWPESIGCYAFEINPFRTLSCDRILPEAPPCSSALAQVLLCVGYPVLVPR